MYLSLLQCGHFLSESVPSSMHGFCRRKSPFAFRYVQFGQFRTSALKHAIQSTDLPCSAVPHRRQLYPAAVLFLFPIAFASFIVLPLPKSLSSLDHSPPTKANDTKPDLSAGWNRTDRLSLTRT